MYANRLLNTRCDLFVCNRTAKTIIIDPTTRAYLSCILLLQKNLENSDLNDSKLDNMESEEFPYPSSSEETDSTKTDDSELSERSEAERTRGNEVTESTSTEGASRITNFVRTKCRTNPAIEKCRIELYSEEEDVISLSRKLRIITRDFNRLVRVIMELSKRSEA